MTRAAVLIGVNKTGGLPVLSDAAQGARRMAAWAVAQGMAARHVHLFTDEAGPVEIGAIKKAIRSLVEAGTTRQLLVYFAGHGVNIRYGEYWLLSGAPIDAAEAVNVEGSVVLARRSGIDHVVFVSDACRTAAEGLQAQGITGGEIFPNDPVDGPERPVDIFFGTTLGRPALEVKDVRDSSAAFRAVYTTALLDAVEGRLPLAVLASPGKKPGFVVRPRSLKACLVAELPRRLAGLGVPSTVSQEPDARITSDDDAWLAGFDEDPVLRSPQSDPRAPARTRGGGGGPGGGASASMPAPVSRGNPVRTDLKQQLDAALGLGPAPGPAPGPALRSRRGVGPSGRPVADPPVPFGPMHMETGCGLKLRGATLAEAVASGADVEVFEDDRSIARVHLKNGPANVLLILADGSGVLLPALPGFITALTFEQGELADIAYEPSEHTPRWIDFAARADELRSLRAVVAAAAREGVFRLDGTAAPELARRMQVAKSVDPALSLYAAYAYHDLQQTDRVREMLGFLRADIGIGFFDLELLSGKATAGPGIRRFPPVPMLAQGWSLLSAFGVPLSDELAPLRDELVDTLWTQFQSRGAQRLKRLVEQGSLP